MENLILCNCMAEVGSEATCLWSALSKIILACRGVNAVSVKSYTDVEYEMT